MRKGKRWKAGSAHFWALLAARVWCGLSGILDVVSGHVPSVPPSTMLASLKKYAHDRRQTAVDAAGIATVSYLAVKFVREKISETRDVRIIDQFCQDKCVGYPPCL